MDGAASPTPKQRIAAECARPGGGPALIAGCVALLGGRPDDVDDRLITVLGGEAAGEVLDGAAGGRSGYWPRVWAARGLLHAWADPADRRPSGDDRGRQHDRDASHRPRSPSRAATAAIIGALADDAWRVREMAAKVVARHRVGGALDAVAPLRDDPIPEGPRSGRSPRRMRPPHRPPRQESARHPGEREMMDRCLRTEIDNSEDPSASQAAPQRRDNSKKRAPRRPTG